MSRRRAREKGGRGTAKKPPRRAALSLTGGISNRKRTAVCAALFCSGGGNALPVFAGGKKAALAQRFQRALHSVVFLHKRHAHMPFAQSAERAARGYEQAAFTEQILGR